MSKFSQKRGRNVGELSSKYAYDRDGSQFEKDIQHHIDEIEQLYTEFKKWLISKNVTPNKFRKLFSRFYDEFIK